MKKRYLLLCLGLYFFSLSAQPNAEEHLVKISNLSSKKLSNLIKLNIDIANVQNRQIAIAYVDDQQFENLKRRGFEVQKIPNRAKLYADSLWNATKNSSDPLAAYHTYDELTAELQLAAQTYPSLCRLESAGNSVQGRDLWIVKISDNVKLEEPEPEFKYISSMHGDEPVGMEMCLYLIRYLLEKYGTVDRVTQLVNNTEIWIMPLMNPDGYVAHRRRNVHDVDLNRNFPDRISDPHNITAGREPETQAIMNLSAAHSFVLSANFHTGALLVNYPYDSNSTEAPIYTACPDDALFIELAKTYSYHNSPMWNSPYFPNGITNGADWYTVFGGMQDWNYVWMGCNEITIELSDNSWPNAYLLSTFWQENRESMLAYLEASHWGIRGIVSDSLTAAPLSATVEVEGIDHQIFSDPDNGDYYRLLLPGIYNLRFTAPNYQTKIINSVQVIQGNYTTLNVQLAPTQHFIVQGTVRDRETNAPLAATLKFISDTTRVAVSDSISGSFQIQLPADEYAISVSNHRYQQIRDTLTVSQNTDIAYLLAPFRFIFETKLETANGNFWASDSIWQWGTPATGPAQAFSGQRVWGTLLCESYPAHANSVLTSPVIALPDAEVLLFSFKHWLEAEADLFVPGTAYDGGVVEISPADSAHWEQIFPVAGYAFVIPNYATNSAFAAGTQLFSGSHDWREETFDLTVFKNKTVRLRFRFGSDAGNEYPFAGWYIDDIHIKYLPRASNVRFADEGELLQSHSILENYPNPFNNSTTVKFSISKKARVCIKIFNLAGQLVDVLTDNFYEPGQYQIHWTGKESNGNLVSSGVYLIQFSDQKRFVTKKAILLQ